MNAIHGRTQGVRILLITRPCHATSPHWWRATDAASKWFVMRRLVSFSRNFSFNRNFQFRFFVFLCNKNLISCSLWGCSKVSFCCCELLIKGGWNVERATRETSIFVIDWNVNWARFERFLNVFWINYGWEEALRLFITSK